MSFFFADFEPSVSGKPPAKVRGGERGNDDDDSSLNLQNAKATSPIRTGQCTCMERMHLPYR